jgi:TonB family protein
LLDETSEDRESRFLHLINGMKKQLGTIALVLLGAIFGFSQAKKSGAPIIWENYKISPRKFSVALPKLPVVTDEKLICSQMNVEKFAAYANDVVYGVNIISKLNEKIPFFCLPAVEFTEKSFQLRIDEIKKTENTAKEETVKLSDREARFIKSDARNYWLINDYERKQWIELWTVNGDENSKIVKDFTGSISFGERLNGIEIGEGSAFTLGDSGEPSPEILATPKSTAKIVGGKGSGSGSRGTAEIVSKTTSTVKQDGEMTPVRIIVKPPPRYTDVARKENIQGTVILRITLLSNGGIGSVTGIEGLPYGLTEQAIIAANKVVFIPAKRNGISISVSKTFQYRFSIF